MPGSIDSKAARARWPLRAACTWIALGLVPIAYAQRPTLSVQAGHAETVGSLAVSPDGALLATGSRDATVKIWERASGLELRTLTGHDEGVYAVAFSPDGRTLASGSGDKTVKLWDVATGKLLRSLEGHTAVVSSIAYLSDGRSLASASSDRTIRIWDTGTGKIRRTLTGHTREVTTIAASADGRRLASEASDSTIRIWDLATGQTLRSIEQRVSSMAMSPDGRTLATGGFAIKLWDVESGELRATLEERAPSSSSGIPGSTLAFSADSRMLGSVDGTGQIKLWHVPSRKLMTAIDCCNRFIDALVFSPDGNMLAGVGQERAIRLWRAPEGASLGQFASHTDRLYSVAFAPDGRSLVSGAFMIEGDGALRLWDLVSGEPPRALEGEQSSAYSALFSADGRQLASGGLDNRIIVRSFPGGRVARVIEAGEPIDQLDASADGRLLASASRDEFVTFWDGRSGKRLRQVSAHPYIHAVALDPQGDTLVTSGTDRLLKIWDAKTGTLRRTLEETALALDFSPDGSSIALGGYSGVSLLDPSSGALRRLQGAERDRVREVAFSPDGRTLASSGSDRDVKIWDVATGALRATLVGHANAAFGLAFSPDGRLLASASFDATIRLWDLATGRELASLLPIGEKDWLVVTPDGLFDGSPGAWSRIRWRFSPQLFDTAPVEVFFNEFFRPGLLTEIVAGSRPLAARDIAKIDRRQPRVTISLPDANPDGPTAGRRTRVVIGIPEAPAGARDVRLFRNGTLAKVWRGDVLDGKPNATLETDIALVPGANRLTAYAFNREDVKSADASIDVTAFGGKHASSIYVIAVGVDRYANSQFDLRYAVADAVDFAEEMHRQQASIAPGVKVEVVPLHDGAATKAGILEAIGDLSGRARPEDTVIVFFAGHGLAHEQRFYLVPHDLGYQGDRDALRGRELQSILSRSVSDRELERAFESVDAGQLLLVIDACHSGQALEAAERRRGPMNSKGLAQLAYEKGMYVLTAAQSYQTAQELSELKHGLLTYTLVEEGLKRSAADRGPRDGTILVREWFDFATDRVPQMQLERMRRAGERGLKLAYVEGEERIAAVEERNVQRPRAFYRRELEERPFVVARVTPPTRRPQ